MVRNGDNGDVFTAFYRNDCSHTIALEFQECMHAAALYITPESCHGFLTLPTRTPLVCACVCADRVPPVFLLGVAMSIVSLPSALALISLVLLVKGSAPGDEHDYCVNTVNVDNPPSAREAGRNILLDTYNYAALLTGVVDFNNPVVNAFPPVFQGFDVDGSDPILVSFLPGRMQIRMNYVLDL